MRKTKLLQLNKKGNDISFEVPAGTLVSDIEKALGYFIVESSKYRGIKSSTFVAEIAQWVQQIEDNQ